MSLHHVLMFHSSPPNRSHDRRIGFAIRYLPTRVRQVAGSGDSALLVRGIDTYRHFEAEVLPARDLEPERAGVELDQGAVRVNARLETTARGIWAAGDVTGGLQFTHVADYMARVVVQNALAPVKTRASCRVVWLEVTPAEAARRVAGEPGIRPLLAGDDPVVRLTALVRERAPHYEATAHHRVATDGRDPDAVADTVLAAVRERAA